MPIKYSFTPNSLLSGENNNTAGVTAGQTIELEQLASQINVVNPLISKDTAMMVLSSLRQATMSHILNGDRVNLVNFLSIRSSISGRYNASETPPISNLQLNAVVSSTFIEEVRNLASLNRIYSPAKSPIILGIMSPLPNGFGPYQVFNGSDLHFNEELIDEGVFFASTHSQGILSRVPTYSKNSGAEVITTAFVPSDGSLTSVQNEWEAVMRTRYTTGGTLRRTDTGYFFRAPITIDMSLAAVASEMLVIASVPTSDANNIDRDTTVVSVDGDYRVAIILEPNAQGTVETTDDLSVSVTTYDPDTGELDIDNKVTTVVPCDCAPNCDLVLDANVSNGSGILSKLGIWFEHRAELATAINSSYKGSLVEYLVLNNATVPTP